MTPSQRQQTEELFYDLSVLEPEDQRRALSLISDPDVRFEVESLLRHTGNGEPGLDTAIAQVVEAASSSGAFGNRTVGPGTRFENYRIERKIGQGGMGDVYEAIRESDFHKRVALKIVRYGLDGDYARTRFQQERQVLAGLEHPFIARLLDGGEATDGCPFLVLEFIEGVAIDAWCQAKPREAILRLFLKVCESVEYAHRNLVIHRDLKPANILVTAKGDPKLLDFGIAKLLDPGGEATQTKLVALTPQYASPEQVRGESITTATDVYSLGVILYELLTGRKPYHLETPTAFEMDRVICQQPVAPPALGDELDHILMMALRKEPSRRYASVLQFAQDIENYLEHRPVSAQPDSAMYRTRKYIRRHWVGLLAASIATTAICVGSGVALYQARIARQRFADVRQLANTFLFEFNDEIATLNGAVKARQMLVNTALRYLDSLSQSAGGDAKLQAELAKAYQKVGDVQGGGAASLGKYVDAAASYQRSLAIYQQLAAADPAYLPDLANAHMGCSFIYRVLGDDKRAIAENEAAVANLEAITRKDPANKLALRIMGVAYSELAALHRNSLEDTDALGAITKSLQFTKAGADYTDPAHVALVLANRMLSVQSVHGEAGDFRRAFSASHDANEYLSKTKQTDTVALRMHVVIEEELSQTYDSDYIPSLGDTPDALLHIQKADEGVSILLKDPNDADAKSIRAVHLRRFSYLRGKMQPAVGIHDGLEAIAILEGLAKLGGKGIQQDEILASTRLLVADQYSRLGREREAREFLTNGLTEYRHLLDRTNNSIFYRRGWLRSLTVAAAIYRKLGDKAAALRTNTEAVVQASGLESRMPRSVSLLFSVGDAYTEYGRYLLQLKQPAEARVWFEKDAGIWRAWSPPNQYTELRKRQAETNLAF